MICGCGMKRKKAVDDHEPVVADPQIDLAMAELGRILMEIAEKAGQATEGESDAAGPFDANAKRKRKSKPRRVKGADQHDRM